MSGVVQYSAQLCREIMTYIIYLKRNSCGLRFLKRGFVFAVIAFIPVCFLVCRRCKQKRLGEGTESLRSGKKRTDKKHSTIPKGIPNLGNTCYMNSVLQVLCWTPGLWVALLEQRRTPINHQEPISYFSYFLNKILKWIPFTPQKVENDVTGALFDLLDITHFSSESISRAVPARILQEVRKINSQFDGHEQQDSYELLNTIISGIEDEEQGSDTSPAEIDDVLFRSAVSRLFGGIFIIPYRYQTCKHIEHVYQKFTSIPVPVAKQIANPSYVDPDISYRADRVPVTCATGEEVVTCTTGKNYDDTERENGDRVNREPEDLEKRKTECLQDVNDGRHIEEDKNVTSTVIVTPNVAEERPDLTHDGITDNMSCIQRENIEVDTKSSTNDSGPSEDHSEFTNEFHDMNLGTTDNLRKETKNNTDDYVFEKDNAEGEYLNNLNSCPDDAKTVFIPTSKGSVQTNYDIEEDCADDGKNGDGNDAHEDKKTTSDSMVLNTKYTYPQTDNSDVNIPVDTDANNARYNEMPHQETRSGVQPQYRCFQSLLSVSGEVTGIEMGLRELTEIEEFNEEVLGCRICSPGQLITQKKLMVMSPPEILILQINKFRQEFSSLVKMDVNVTYPKYLNMSPYCSNVSIIPEIRADVGSGESLYSLYGVVSHVGTLKSGHYSAFINTDSKLRQSRLEKLRDIIMRFWNGEKIEKRTEDDTSTWYHVSDMTVRKCSEEDAIHNPNAYLLMFKRIQPL